MVASEKQIWTINQGFCRHRQRIPNGYAEDIINLVEAHRDIIGLHLKRYKELKGYIDV